MSLSTPTTDPDLGTAPASEDAGLGTLRTERGNLPLETLQLRARITGLLADTELEQGFRNPFDVPLEATYIFPLPDRAAVTGMRMSADDRVIEAELRERGEARTSYDRAIAAGQRAAIAEQERPDVFTMRVGNILPGERVTVTLTLAGQLPYEDGEATYRFPLVVAPRYIPGEPLDAERVGDGYARDTDAVPDASRITPPVLLPGFPHPVRLGIDITMDTGGLPLAGSRSSLPVEATEHGWRVLPGQRADRDFILRLRYGSPVSTSHSLTLAPDPEGGEGTFQLTVLPPYEERGDGATTCGNGRSRDLVLVFDRSGSMRGWKMAAARRAASRIVETLAPTDRFTLLAFDTVVEHPWDGLLPATDHHRFRGVTYLTGIDARGGTELLTPMREALSLLAGGDPSDDEGRERVLVLVTDGQVGNEDQLVRETAALSGVRIHTVGIDKAVNAGFLGRLAAAGGGRCELVESEQRLDEAMERIHRRIAAPLVNRLSYEVDGLAVLADTVAPAPMPDLFPGVPLLLTGRYRGTARGAMVVRGTDADGAPWTTRVAASVVDTPASAATWARAHLRDLEDRYASARRQQLGALERQIVSTSLRFSVLCRFTAYVAVDARVVTEGGTPHRVVQPVESPAGWDMLNPPAAPAGPPPMAALSRSAMDMAMPQSLSGPGPVAAGRIAGVLRAGLARPAARLPRKPLLPPSGRASAAVPPTADSFAVEATRMRTAAGAPERERRQLLADLVSRLDAVVGRPVTGDRLVRLRQLLDELRGEAALALPTAAFERVWQRMRELLDRLTAGGTVPTPPADQTIPTPPAGEATPTPTPPRREFWKRS